MMFSAIFLLVVLLLQQTTDSFNINNFVARFHDQRLASAVMKSSDEMFEQPPLILKHIGDYDTATEVRDVDKIQREREFLVNMGRAMETLRRELPYAFHMSNLRSMNCLC